jgi:hypothetical protein
MGVRAAFGILDFQRQLERVGEMLDDFDIIAERWTTVMRAFVHESDDLGSRLLRLTRGGKRKRLRLRQGGAFAHSAPSGRCAHGR